MVANSSNSQKKDKRSTKKTKRPITPEEACELLASAISYCNEAGLVVTGKNHDLSLRLQIAGVNYADGKFVVTSPENKVTTTENVVTQNEEVTTKKGVTEKEFVVTPEEVTTN